MYSDDDDSFIHSFIRPGLLSVVNLPNGEDDDGASLPLSVRYNEKLVVVCSRPVVERRRRRRDDDRENRE
jgi:hypothetical protein